MFRPTVQKQKDISQVVTSQSSAFLSPLFGNGTGRVLRNGRLAKAGWGVFLCASETCALSYLR